MTEKNAVSNLDRRIVTMIDTVLVDPGKYASIKQKCNGQKSFEEIFSCIWDLEEAHRYMTPTLVVSEKSEDEADKLRSEGNVYFKKGTFEKALELYNLSIMTAPHPILKEVDSVHSETTNDATSHSETNNEDDCYAFPRIDPARYGGIAKGESKALAKGFANRSAVMIELDFPEKCLRDINLALEYGYPEELRTKLEERRQRCLAAQNRALQDQGLSSLNKMSKLSIDDKEHRNFDAESTLHEKLAVSQNSLQPGESPTLKKLLSLTPWKPIKLIDRNPSVPSLSSAVKVSYTPSKGRGLVAVRRIHPGEVLAVERAYNVSIDHDKLSTYCSTCLEFCLTPLPCPACVKVIFCSESCRKRGLTEEHWIECRILPTLIALKVETSKVPYKLLKTISYNQLNVMLNQLQNEQCDLPENLGRDGKGVYSSVSYQAIHHLCTNKDKYSTNDLFIISLFTFLFIKLLQHSGRYFVNDDGDPVTPNRKDIVTTGAVLVSHMLLVKCGGRNLMNKQQGNKIVGKGVFPAASLMNHSCDHSAHLNTQGRELIFRAIRPIEAGEEVTDCYTYNFARETLKERKEMLAVHFINCFCVACMYNWPTFDYLPRFRCIECKEGSMGQVCSNCQFKCHLKSKEEAELLKKRWKDITTQVQLAMDKAVSTGDELDSGECISKEDVKVLCHSIELVNKYMARPCQSICYLENTLVGCFERGVLEM